MFEFLFGLAWTGIITPIFIMCLVVPGEQRGGVDMDLPLFFFFVIFEIAGLYLLTSGLKTMTRSKKIKKYGKKCYGLIVDIVETGTYINDDPEYQAIIDIYNPETNKVEFFEVVIGLDDELYEINSYVLCKNYKGDVSIEKVLPVSEVPVEMTKHLIPEE